MAQSLSDLGPALKDDTGGKKKGPPRRKRKPPPFGYERLRQELKNRKKKEGKRER